MEKSGRRILGMGEGKQVLFLSLFLSALTLTAFWQVSRCEFLSYDDPTYVTENPTVLGGLTLEGVRWAFTTLHAEFWHPLTWLSHMLDVQLFGLSPRGHHGTNLFFHLLNSLLLFLIFHRMTRAAWKSFSAASLFAIHPLHVESVAWVAERKDVLSTFFFFLTLGGYSYYAERPGAGRYLAVLLSFVLGLMAKPMLVTLPFVLLLLDYWPLRRFYPAERTPPAREGGIRPEGKDKQKRGPAGRLPAKPGEKPGEPAPAGIRALLLPLLGEKIPLLALAAGASLLAYFAQQPQGEAALPAAPLSVRAANAFLSYISYLGKTIWPSNLGVFYPYPEEWKLWQVAGSVFLLTAVSFLTVRFARKFPFLAVGWFWYLGTLVPVIGFVQVGEHAMADRYTYIPLTGLFIMAAWGVPEILQKWRYGRETMILSPALVLAALLWTTWNQVGHWRNSVTLFNHTLRVTEPNSLSYLNRGLAWWKAGDFQHTLEDLNRAVELRPDYARPYQVRASLLASLGQYPQAMEDANRAIELYPASAAAYHTRAAIHASRGDSRRALEDCDKALELDPLYATAYQNRATIRLNLGEFHRAIEDSDRALKLNPKYAEAYLTRGQAYARLGDTRKALHDYDRALEINPISAPARTHRGAAYEALGELRRAIQDYDQALAIDPNYAPAYSHRGNAHGSAGNTRQALEDLGKAIELNPRSPAAYNHRAGIYGSLGRYREAIEDCNEAIRLNPDYAEAYNNRGNAHARLGQFGRAIRDYDRALELNPKYAAAWNNRAAAHWGTGSREKALADLRTAARLGFEPARKALKSQGMDW